MRTLTNSEVHDELPHDAAFHQDLHGFITTKAIFSEGVHLYVEINTCDLSIYNGLSEVYCIKPKRRIH